MTTATVTAPETDTVAAPTFISTINGLSLPPLLVDPVPFFIVEPSASFCDIEWEILESETYVTFTENNTIYKINMPTKELADDFKMYLKFRRAEVTIVDASPEVIEDHLWIRLTDSAMPKERPQ